MFEKGKIAPTKDPEPQKRAKNAKRTQRRNMVEGLGTEIVSDCHAKVPIWNPMLKLDGGPLPMDSSIRDFQQGKACYVANALEQPLLLPQDMADLRTLKKHEVFLTLKRDLAMVRTSTCYSHYFLFKNSPN